VNQTPITWGYEGIPAYRFAWILSAEMLSPFPMPQRFEQVEIAEDGAIKALCWDIVYTTKGDEHWFRRDNFRWEPLPYTGRLELRLRIPPRESNVERFVWLDYQDGKLTEAQDATPFVLARFSREIAHLADAAPEA
jgi:hypothetical protein